MSITVKNSSYGTATDKEGDFKLAVIKGEKIIISFSGYQEQVVNATDNFLPMIFFLILRWGGFVHPRLLLRCWLLWMAARCGCLLSNAENCRLGA